ncbi:hypothetical protein E4U10_003454 [Claviceps purpurea]|nr:hypothetical protein E4U10_003454 [Claviceps purpurea]
MDSSPERKCSGCRQTLPLCDFPSKNSKILLTCVRCTVCLQLEGGSNPPTNVTPDENEKTTGGRTAARAAETSTTHSAPLPPSRPCSGCSKRRPVTDFPLKNPLGDAHGERYRVCAPYKVKRDNRRPPRRGPNQTAPPHPEQLDEQLDEQDADEQDDGPPPARPRQETPAIDLDSVPKQHCSGWELSETAKSTSPEAANGSAADRPGGRCWPGEYCTTTCQTRAAEQRGCREKKNGGRGKGLAAALRVTEAIARQAEAIARHARVQAEPTMAAVAKAEAVRRVVRATQKASRAMRASQEARRAAVLQESMNAAAAAQAKVEAARLAAYRPRFGPISTPPPQRSYGWGRRSIYRGRPSRERSTDATTQPSRPPAHLTCELLPPTLSSRGTAGVRESEVSEGTSECGESGFGSAKEAPFVASHGEGIFTDPTTVGQFVKVGSELLESGVSHLQVGECLPGPRASVRVEEDQIEVVEYPCHIINEDWFATERARVAYVCSRHLDATRTSDGTRTLGAVAQILKHLILIFFDPNRGSKDLKMTHTEFQEFRTNFYELAHRWATGRFDISLGAVKYSRFLWSVSIVKGRATLRSSTDQDFKHEMMLNNSLSWIV